MAAHVVVVGSLNADLVVRAPRLPAPGETILGSEFHTLPGGKGANQAVAAARLGARVTMVGRVGQDAHGDLLVESLDRAGVDRAFVAREGNAPTGVALIVLDRAGQNSIVVVQGANTYLAPGDVDRAEAAIAGADVLLAQLEIPIETVVRAAQVAHGHGVPLILNPAPARSLPDDLMALVDVLIPNESETAQLAGLPAGDVGEARAAGRALRESTGGTVVVTLGERGALLVQGASEEVFPAFRVTAVDTTAAGDAFVAGFAVAFAETKNLAKAVRWGNAAGALASTRLGAQPSLPGRRAVEMLILGD